MKQQFYINTVNNIRNNKRLCGLVVYLGRVTTAAVYVFYPCLLIFLALTRNPKILRAIIVPALGFIAVSAVRYLINFPRPYEKIEGLQPLYNKKTVGKSFPSRHTFSVFIIAAVSLYFSIPVGILIFLLGFTLAICRVLSGVHFIRDVAVGALSGAVFGIIGMYLI